ncbi:hypothetical protein OROGR_026404 [Orobanche gracilis]
MRRQQNTIKCRKCGKPGHNIKTCTEIIEGRQPNEAVISAIEVEQPPKRRKLEVKRASTSSMSNITMKRFFVVNDGDEGRNPTRAARGLEEAQRKAVVVHKKQKEKTVRAPTRTLGLIDEDDPEDLEAFFSQASNATQVQGMSTSRNVCGPTPWEQLQMGQGQWNIYFDGGQNMNISQSSHISGKGK